MKLRLKRIEAAANLSLLPKSMQRTHVLEHLVEGLLRARSSERVAFYQSAVSTGWMTRNEVRERENLNPGGPELDEFLEPAFLTGAQPNTPPNESAADTPATDKAAA